MVVERVVMNRGNPSVHWVLMAVVLLSGLLADCSDTAESEARCLECSATPTTKSTQLRPRLSYSRGLTRFSRSVAGDMAAVRAGSLEEADLSEEGGATKSSKRAHIDYTKEALRFREAVGMLAGEGGLLKPLWKGNKYCRWKGIACRRGKPVTFALHQSDDNYNVTKLPDDMFDSPLFSHLKSIYVEWNLNELPSSLLKGEFRPRSLKKLVLRSMSVSDLTPLRGISPSIEIFQLYGLPMVQDLSVVGHLPNLSELHVVYTNIDNIPWAMVSECRFKIANINNNANLISIDGLDSLESVRSLYISRNAALRTLPEGLGNVKGLSDLEVRGSPLLKTLPLSLKNAMQLLKLHVTQCGLTTFVPEYSLPPSLQELYLDKNNIQHLPKDFFRDSHGLEELSMDSNPIQALPALMPLARLREFSCEHCPMGALPEEVGSWKVLDKLTITYHRMESLPLRMNNMTRLMTLVVTDGPLAELPYEFGGMRLLRTLDLSRNTLTSLPISMNELGGLKTLDISGNNLAKLPQLALQKLQKLNLSRNSLRSLPDMSKIRLLNTLDASHNMIEKVESLPLFLKRLYIQDNRLIRFDSRLVLRVLTHLNMRGNLLVEFPKDWPFEGGVMDVSDNRLTTLHIPTGIQSITCINNRVNTLTYDGGDADLSIKHFDLADNELVSFPVSLLRRLRQLTYFSLSGNMLTDSSAILQRFNGKRDTEIRLDNNLVSDYSSAGIEVGVQSTLALDEVLVNGSIIADLLRISDSSELIYHSHDHTNRPGRQCHLSTTTHNSRTLSLRKCQCAADFYRVGRGPYGEVGACRPCVGNGHCSDGQITCETGYILVARNEPRCEPCPSRGIECSHNKARVLPGYWSPQEGFLTAFACTHPHLCLGDQKVSESLELAELGESMANRTCVGRNYGPLCSLCETGYFPDATGYCIQCPSLTESVLYVTSFFVGLMVLLALLVFIGKAPEFISNSKGQVDEEHGTGMKTNGELHERLDILMQAVKIVIGFVQVLCTFPKLYDVQWGKVFSQLSDMFGWVNLSFLSPSSMGCLWENLAKTSTPDLAFRYSHVHTMVLTAVLPLIGVVAAIVFAAVWQAVRAVLSATGGVSSRMMWVFCGRFCSLLLLLVYIPASTTALEYFRCRSFDEGATYYVEVDLSIRCYDLHWYEGSIVPACIIAFYTIGIPLTIFVALFPGSMKHRCRVVGSSSPQLIFMRCPLGFVPAGVRDILNSLYSTYRKEYRWWDVSELIRKVMVTGVAVHCGSAPSFQISVSLVVTFVAFGIHQAVRPFSSRMLNLMQTVTLGLLYFTLSIGLLESVNMPVDLAAQYTATILVLDVIVVAVIAMKLFLVLSRLAWRLMAVPSVRGVWKKIVGF